MDAYGEQERSLHDKIQFPFPAFVSKKRSTNPLKVGEKLKGAGLADSDDCCQEILVLIHTEKGEKYAIPLDQIEPLPDTDKKTVEAVLDWHYWVSRGYLF